jgi:hypothetical protein
MRGDGFGEASDFFGTLCVGEDDSGNACWAEHRESAVNRLVSWCVGDQILWLPLIVRAGMIILQNQVLRLLSALNFAHFMREIWDSGKNVAIQRYGDPWHCPLIITCSHVSHMLQLEHLLSQETTSDLPSVLSDHSIPISQRITDERPLPVALTSQMAPALPLRLCPSLPKCPETKGF